MRYEKPKDFGHYFLIMNTLPISVGLCSNFQIYHQDLITMFN